MTSTQVDASALASNLAIRTDALARFCRAVEPYLPADWLTGAQAVAATANARLARSRTHTVVAFAGTTGSGKSSLFNALAGMELSEVALRRPTTAVVHACVWGSPAEAGPLLDWLEVPERHRFLRESALDADDQADLRGLILLDLPDFDSLQREHADEVEQRLALADQIIWVTDPQKYADRVLHDQLRRFQRYQDVMATVLNQTDLLSAADTEAVLADLRRLLAADGLPKLPVLAASAVTGPDGLADLRALLRQRVAQRRASFQRLSADLDEVAAGLADLVGPPAPGDLTADRPLLEALTEAAEVPSTVDTVTDWYTRQAAVRMRFRGGRPPHLPDLPAPADPGARRAAASLAARAWAERVAADLPLPWPVAVTDAARSRLDELPDALHTALTGAVTPYRTRFPWWWNSVRNLRRASVGLVLLGAALLAWFWAQPHQVTPHPTGVGLMVAGLVLLVLLAVLARPLRRGSTRRLRRDLEQRLREVVTEATREYVVAPADRVWKSYEQARVALATTRSDPA